MLETVILAGCGSGEGRPSASTSEPDASQLVVQLSDLPSGFNLDPAESFPVPTSKILAEPFSASSSAIIRRERLSGYQAAFTSPLGHPIECTAAVYQSSASARRVYRLQTQSVAAFVAETGGRSLPVGRIGEETYASRFELGPASYQGVAWRFRNVLSTCISLLADVLVVARAQQQRLAGVLGHRR